jgi:hypothetical protein
MSVNQSMCRLAQQEVLFIMNKIWMRARHDSWPDNDSIGRFLMEMKMVRLRFLKKFLFNCFPASVDYGAKLEEFVKTPGFQVMSSCIIFEKFSKIAGAKKKVEFGFFFLPRMMTTAQIVAAMRKRNLRPANFQELMYFSRSYLQLLKLFELSSPSADYRTASHVYFARAKSGAPFDAGGKRYVDVHTFSHYRAQKEKIVWHPDAQVILGVYMPTT